MSFYSYKNANADCSPGVVNGNILSGLNQRVCIQVKNVYDSALSQEQLDDKEVVISNIVPVLPGNDCKPVNSVGCRCSCRLCGIEGWTSSCCLSISAEPFRGRLYCPRRRCRCC